jgi:hypothetical protein
MNTEPCPLCDGTDTYVLDTAPEIDTWTCGASSYNWPVLVTAPAPRRVLSPGRAPGPDPRDR